MDDTGKTAKETFSQAMCKNHSANILWGPTWPFASQQKYTGPATLQSASRRWMDASHRPLQVIPRNST